MRTKFIMTGIALLLSATSLLFASAHSLCGSQSINDGDEIILIHQLPNTLIGTPRSPSTVIIEATLCTELYVIDVRLQNAGTSVTVDIENATTGTSYEYFVSGDGSDSLPISSTPGFWTITFTLSDGSVYAGNFII